MASVPEAVLVVDRMGGWLPHATGRTIVIGVANARQRARLLAQGVGDVLSPGTDLDELAIRARRVIDRAAQVPRWRRVDALTLDLLRREGYLHDCPLLLHPREFEMAWHLAALEGGGADRTQLLRDVWSIHHEPETNSVAVHAFRIRAKLRVHGLDRMLATDRDGRYRLMALDDCTHLSDKTSEAICEERQRDRTVL